MITLDRLPLYAHRHVRIHEYPYPGDDLEHIVDNIRDCDRHEFESVGLPVDGTAPAIVVASSHCYLATLRGEPVFIWGAMRRFHHVYDIFGFGTDKTPRVMPALTKWGLSEWLPAMFDDGAVQRLELRVPASCTHSIKWLTEDLGLRIEAAIPGYSQFGETYFQLALTRDNYVHDTESAATRVRRAGTAEVFGSDTDGYRERALSETVEP